MTFKDFKAIIDLMVQHDKVVSQAYELNIDLMDFCNNQSVAISALWAQILTVEGKDWLDWFLYEKDYVSGNLRKDLKAYDGKKEICKDLKGLYDYLIKQNYFKIK